MVDRRYQAWYVVASELVVVDDDLVADKSLDEEAKRYVGVLYALIPKLLYMRAMDLAFDQCVSSR